MTDFLSTKQRSKVMAAVRSRGNVSTERRLAEILRAHQISGWRRHQPLPGKPDFVFRHARLAVFVDGCFWHGCRWHCRLPKSRRKFWKPKIERNKERDRQVAALLHRSGWRVLRFWEHSLSDPDVVIQRLQAVLVTRGAER